MNPFLSLVETVAATERQSEHTHKVSEMFEAAAARRFGVDFQPIVAADETLLAWRAKARFTGADGQRLSPSAVFAALHRNPALLRATELHLKRLALENAPADGWLLVPLDADSYAAAGAGDAGNPFDLLFGGLQRLIVEICENRSMTDVARLHGLLRNLAAQGIPLAVGSRTPVVACLNETLCDADWLRVPCPQNLREPRHICALETIAESARQAGSSAFVSGVRSAEALAIVRAIGFSGASGPVFDDRVDSPTCCWADQRFAAAACEDRRRPGGCALQSEACA